MDIQQLMTLTNAATQAPARRGGAPAGDDAGAFAAELARVAAAGEGPSGAARGAQSGGPAYAAPALEALRQAQALPHDELLNDKLPHGDMKALEAWLGDAGMPPGDAERLPSVLAAGDEWSALRERLALVDQALVDQAGRPTEAGFAPGDEWSALREQLALVDQALADRALVDQAGRPTEAGFAPGDEWSALRERLALVDQALADRALVNQAGRPTEAGLAQGDEWSALRERLALIDQAGRSTATDLAAGKLTESPPAGLTALVGDNAGPSGAPRSGTEAAPRGALQYTAQEAMPRNGQAPVSPRADDAQAPRLTSAEMASAGLNRQAEVTTTLASSTQASSTQAEGSRGNPMEGLSSLSGNAASHTPPTTASGQSATQTATAGLSAPVGSPAWPQQLGQQLIRMGQNGGEQRVELKLHPAELGPLSISLKLSDQGAQAQFLSAHGQVRQILEQSIPQLREALAEQGIELGEATVGEQHAGNGGHDESHENDAPLLASEAAVDNGEAGAESLSEVASGHTVSLDGRVDLYT